MFHDKRKVCTPRTGRTRLAQLAVSAALIFGSMLVASTAQSQALVKVTPLGSHSGELCFRDRALLFEDPTGVRILYDPGQTTDETDPRLNDVHVILVSHAHADHIGTTRPNRGGGTCAAPATGAANSSSNAATIAAARNAAVMTSTDVTAFLGLKIQAIRGTPMLACDTGGLENEITVPAAAPCAAAIGIGGSRTIRRGGASASVRITGVQAIHPSSIPAALIDAPGVPSGTTGYGGVAMGFVVRFTNGLTAYLTGDTGVFGDMQQVISKFYRPNLMVINIGPGINGPAGLGPDEAVYIVQNLLRPTTVMPSHVGEQATSGGAVRANTWTEWFVRYARPFADVILPVSDATLAFDGDGRCIGCPR